MRGEKFSFKRPCRDCEEMYQPKGKYAKYCDACIEKRHHLKNKRAYTKKLRNEKAHGDKEIMKSDKEFGKGVSTTGINGMLWLRYFEKGIIISNRNHGKVKLNWIDAMVVFEELKRFKENNELIKELES